VDAKMRQLAAIRTQLEDLAACHCTNDCPVIGRVLAAGPSQAQRRR
jgi:hypothetical protein